MDFFNDILNWWKNINFYKSEAFDELDWKVFYNKWKKIDNFRLASYWTVLSLNLFKKEQINNEPIIRIDNLGDNLKEYDFSYIADKLKPKETVSINELSMLNLFLSWKIQDLEKYFWSNYKEKLNKLSKKCWFNNTKKLKNYIYDKEIKKYTNNRKIQNNANIFYNLPLKKAEYIINIIDNYIVDNNPKIKQKYLKRLYSELSMMNNNDKTNLSSKLNSFLKKEGIKPIEDKEIENTYNEKVENVFLIMNWIDWWLDKDTIYDKFLSWLENIWKKITDINNFKKAFQKFLNPDNIENLKKDFAKNSWSPMQFFMDKIFNSSNFWKYLNSYWKLNDVEKAKIVNLFMSVIKDNLKKKKLSKSIDLIKNNKEIERIINPLFNNEFKNNNNDKSSKFKKDLLKLNFEYDISTIIPKNWILTKKVIEQKQDKMLKKQIWNSEWEINNEHLEKAKNILNSFKKKIPSEWLKFDVNKLKEIRDNLKLIKKIEKDQQLYNKLGYEWYLNYYENIEAEKKLLEWTWWLRKTFISIEESPFKDKSLDSNKVETIYEEKGWIHTIYMHLPWIENKIIKIESLKLSDTNKEAINVFFNKKFWFPIKIKWNIDEVNKLVSQKADISNNSIWSDDFKEIIFKTQNIIYHNFYKNWWKKERKEFPKRKQFKRSLFNVFKSYWIW